MYDVAVHHWLQCQGAESLSSNLKKFLTEVIFFVLYVTVIVFAVIRASMTAFKMLHEVMVFPYSPAGVIP